VSDVLSTSIMTMSHSALLRPFLTTPRKPCSRWLAGRDPKRTNNSYALTVGDCGRRAPLFTSEEDARDALQDAFCPRFAQS